MLLSAKRICKSNILLPMCNTYVTLDSDYIVFLHNEDCFTDDGRDANPLRVLDGLLRGYDRRSTPHRHQGAGAATLVWTELYIASLGSINTDNMVS